MRNGMLSSSALAPYFTSLQHGSWTARLLLAALLVAAFTVALLPDRASAHHANGSTYADHCRDVNDPRQNGVRGSLFGNIADSEEFIEDCISLLKAADGFTEGEDTDINWLFEDDSDLPFLTYTDVNESAWNGIYIEETGAAPNQEYRITRVDLSSEDLGGALSPAWAELTALTSLDLSNNRLGTDDNGASVPLSVEVWKFFDGLEALNLDGNKDLRPSPPLNMSAAASKTADGEPQATLSFDNVWYTLEVSSHEYRYSADGGSTWGPNEAANSGGWMPVATGCTDPEPIQP